MIGSHNRQNDSIRSWIKNPGPLTRESNSKFQETEHSVDHTSAMRQNDESPNMTRGDTATLGSNKANALKSLDNGTPLAIINAS